MQLEMPTGFKETIVENNSVRVEESRADDRAEDPIKPNCIAWSSKLINLLDRHIAETRAKFPDDPAYEGVPDYEPDDE